MQSKEIPDQKAPGWLADQHWSEVMDAAKRYGFVAQAYGGTALLLTHRVQLEEYGEGGYLRIQKMCGHCARDLGYRGCLNDNGQLLDCTLCALNRPEAGAAQGGETPSAQQKGSPIWVKCR